MRITTWNVNGLATTLQYYPWSETKSFKTLLDALEADIICLQEVKCQRSKLTKDMALVPGYDCYLSFSKRRLGYSGVAVYVKQPFKPISCEEGITGILGNSHDLGPFLGTLETPAPQLDEEGRCLILEFDQFVLFNIYFPNDAEGTRTTFKMDYHHTVTRRIEQIKDKEVVLVGDVNALYAEVDHFAPQLDIKERGIDYFQQLPHRAWLEALVAPKGPLVDVTRVYHPERQGMFTVWNTKLNARASNLGTRIDYILVTKQLATKVSYSDIQPDIKGSDHCPVYAVFDIELNRDQPPLSTPLLASNFSEFSIKQKKVSSYFQMSSASQPLSTITATTATQQITSSQPVSNTTKKRKTIDSFFSSSSNKKTKAEKSELEKSELEKMIEIQSKGIYPDEFKVTEKGWDNLFKAPDVPLCEVHRVKCIEHVVSKKGPNQGRVFYVCSKPIGPPDGNKDLYRCNFFKWKKSQ